MSDHPLLCPPPLRPGDMIAVTASSSPVRPEHEGRLSFVSDWLRRRGYRVVLGDCLLGDSVTSAPAQARADEFNAFVRDPQVRAIVPPWGGELAIDLVDLLDVDALWADPTWVVGWSDISTVLLPLTLRSGVATVHGQNLMDTPYALPRRTAHWLDIVALGSGESFTQRDPGVRRRGGFDDWETPPEVDRYYLSEASSWRVLQGPSEVEMTGRLIGGCLDVVCHLAGTPYGDVGAFARTYAPAGGIIYLENCESSALDAARMLHGMRLGGWFENASGVLIGRTAARASGDPASPAAAAGPPNARPRASGDLTQDGAVLDALGCLDVPIIADVDFGHVPPGNVLVNGASAHVVVRPGRHEITQTLP